MRVFPLNKPSTLLIRDLARLVPAPHCISRHFPTTSSPRSSPSLATSRQKLTAMKAIAIISALCTGLASGTPARLLDHQCDNHLDCGGCLGQGDKSFTVVYSEAKAREFSEPLSCSLCYELGSQKPGDPNKTWCSRRPALKGEALEKVSGIDPLQASLMSSRSRTPTPRAER